MKRYVCYIGTKDLNKAEADIHFESIKVKISTQWNAAADNSIVIFVKEPTSSRTEILGLPD